MQNILQAQSQFFNSNQTKSVEFRINQLKKLKSVLLQHEVEMYAAIFTDFGKSKFDTYTSELGLVHNEIDFAIRNVAAWAKPKRVRTNLFNLPGLSYIIPEPLGVCLVIGAWNYPYLLSLSPMIAAMVAGNTVVLKPSELPIQTSAILAKIINENFEPTYLKVVEGGIEETSELLKQKWDKIFFTGSTNVGKIVYKAAAENMIPVTLELGGKSPAFICESANLKVAARRIVWGKFLNAGQTCIAPDYLYVHESIKNDLIAALKREIEATDFSIENANYTKIINERNFTRLIGLMENENCVIGGVSNREKRIIEPTILTDITWDSNAMKEEIFGPILPIITFTNLDDAIKKVKQEAKPLSCYIFTTNATEKKKLLSEISFGGGTINDSLMHISNHHLPFGGVGMSGIGSYHGKFGFDTFSHQKAILEKSNYFETKLKYSPHSDSRFAWIKRLLKY